MVQGASSRGLRLFPILPGLTTGPELYCRTSSAWRELVADVGGFATVSRNRFWLRNGYAEEVFRLSQARRNRS